MEEAHRVGQGVLDEHAVRVASNQCLVGGLPLVGEQYGGLVVAEVLDEELAEHATLERDVLLIDAREAELTRDAVQLDLAPGRAREVGDLA